MSALKKRQYLLPSSLEIVALGTASAQTFNLFSPLPVKLPTIADSEHLLLLPAFTNIGEKKILLIKGEQGRELISQTLKERGAHVTILNTYKRTAPTFAPERINSLWRNNEVDIILFTSGEAIMHFTAFLNKKAAAWMANIPCIVISRRLAEIAHRSGFKNTLVTHYDYILECITKNLEYINKYKKDIAW